MTLPEWIHSQGGYFEPRAGGEVKIFGFYTNKQNKQTKYGAPKIRLATVWETASSWVLVPRKIMSV